MIFNQILHNDFLTALSATTNSAPPTHPPAPTGAPTHPPAPTGAPMTTGKFETKISICS